MLSCWVSEPANKSIIDLLKEWVRPACFGFCLIGGLWLGTSPLRSQTSFHDSHKSFHYVAFAYSLSLPQRRQPAEIKDYWKIEEREDLLKWNGPKTHNQTLRNLKKLISSMEEAVHNFIQSSFPQSKQKINLLFLFRQFDFLKLNWRSKNIL